MEELAALRKLVETHDYSAALMLIDEMDEMAKDDKITKVISFLHVLLVHLIKRQVEKRTTNSWERSINHAVSSIFHSNKRRSSGGFYLKNEELKSAIDEAFSFSIREAAEEAFGGAFDAPKLFNLIDKEAIKKEALDLILTYEP